MQNIINQIHDEKRSMLGSTVGFWSMGGSVDKTEVLMEL